MQNVENSLVSTIDQVDNSSLTAGHARFPLENDVFIVIRKS